MLFEILKEGFCNEIKRFEYYKVRVFLMVILMVQKKGITVTLNYPKEDKALKELKERKATIVLEILKEKYEDKVLEEYINSIRKKK